MNENKNKYFKTVKTIPDFHDKLSGINTVLTSVISLFECDS